MWTCVLLIVSIRAFYWPETRTVYPIFSESAHFFWAETDMYFPHRPEGALHGYRYSPTFPILMTPFAWLPDSLGGVLWRVVNVALFLLSLAWFARAVLPIPLNRNQVALLMVLVIPLSVQTLNNAQANMLVISCLLGAVAAVKEARWNLGGFLIGIAFICKLYPLALGLLLMVLYPRKLAWRIPAFCIGLLCLPILLKGPGYVLDQYGKWFALLNLDDRSLGSMDQMYRDLWLLIRSYRFPMSRPMYEILQVLSGIGLAVLCWMRQREGWPVPALLSSTFCLGCAWMMLLGPATESCTYILLAPALAWSILEVLQFPHRHWRQILLALSCLNFLAAALLGVFPKVLQYHTLGFHAFGALFYFVYLIAEPRPGWLGEEGMGRTQISFPLT